MTEGQESVSFTATFNRSFLEAVRGIGLALVDEVVVTYDDGKWVVNIVDPAHISAARIKSFDYVIEEGTPFEFGLDLGKLRDILDLVKDEKVKLKVTRKNSEPVEEGPIPTIVEASVPGEGKLIKRMDVSKWVPIKYPNLNLPITFVVTTTKLQKAMRFTRNISNVASFRHEMATQLVMFSAGWEKDALNFNANEELSEYAEYCLGMLKENPAKPNYVSLYPDDYLRNLVKAIDSKYFTDVSISFGNDTPVVLTFVSMDKTAVEVALAPRIENH